MKITVISVVKNSADIIETFIRANGLFADNFVLVNNGSTDRTVDILNALTNGRWNNAKGYSYSTKYFCL